jgi:eukaryotic-like serine/threonine-protein kinase
VTDAVLRLSTALADHYRIERELGQGGMATVYLAHDLKHDRKVAIKVLRPELAAVIGAERFLREIKTIATLQHPHILGLIDSGEVNGTAYYVMPFVEGESLRDRLSREKQLPIGDAIRVATEVASALDYAHRHGVIHRDIKPENILLHDGSALVADFGIALALSSAGGTRMTETGMSLGTPHYMSPEQAMGEREITARADIYALGAMTYEMLVGEPPFTGPTAQSIVAKVMTEKPVSLIARRERVPPAVEEAVLTALEKLPADRFGTAAEFAATLTSPTATTTRLAVGAAPRRRRDGLVVAVVGIAALAAGLLLGRRQSDVGSVGPEEIVRASLALGDSVAVQAISNLRLAVSPSGKEAVFVGPEGSSTALWLRRFDQPAAQILPDTKGAFAPFYSPDGRAIGFFTAASGRTVLRIIPAGGGVAQTVLEDSMAPFGGASWGDDGRIYFTAASRGIASITASGSDLRLISRVDSGSIGREHDYPDVLPGSRHALVMLWNGSPGANHIGVVDLKTGAFRDLTPGSFARYVTPGFLVIGGSDGRLLAARFDPRGARLLSAPVPVLQEVQAEGANGTVQFGVSQSGTLVYQGGAGGLTNLVWVDRAGGRTPVDTALKGEVQNVAISPDGSRIAFNRADQGQTQIWVRQLSTGSLTRLSFDVVGADRPVWTPDGQKVAFLATRNGRRTAWVRKADGSDSLRPASPGPTRLDEIVYDPLGRYTVVRTEGSGTGTRRLLLVQNGVDTVPRLLLQSPADNFAPVLSPDGKWLAYVSTESGVSEIYVRPFPSVDSARFTISVGGGIEPLWRRDGTELFFRNTRGALFAVPVTTGRTFDHGTPHMLFTSNVLVFQEFYRSYDITPDGKRFLMLASGGTSADKLDVIFNWRRELEKVTAAVR